MCGVSKLRKTLQYVHFPTRFKARCQRVRAKHWKMLPSYVPLFVSPFRLEHSAVCGPYESELLLGALLVECLRAHTKLKSRPV